MNTTKKGFFSTVSGSTEHYGGNKKYCRDLHNLCVCVCVCVCVCGLTVTVIKKRSCNVHKICALAWQLYSTGRFGESKGGVCMCVFPLCACVCEWNESWYQSRATQQKMCTQYTITGPALEQLSEAVHNLYKQYLFSLHAAHRKPLSAFACPFLCKWNINEYYIQAKTETWRLKHFIDLTVSPCAG